MLSTTPHAAATRPIAETDLFKFTWIADPEISPDDAKVAFVKVVVNEKGTGTTGFVVVDARPDSTPADLTGVPTSRQIAGETAAGRLRTRAAAGSRVQETQPRC